MKAIINDASQDVYVQHIASHNIGYQLYVATRSSAQQLASYDK